MTSSFYKNNNNKDGGKYDNFLTLEPDFGWGNCLSLTLNK